MYAGGDVRKSYRFFSRGSTGAEPTGRLAWVLLIAIAMLVPAVAEAVGTSPGARYAAPPAVLPAAASHSGTLLLAEATASLQNGHGPGGAGLAAPASTHPLASPSSGVPDALVYDAVDGYVLTIAPSMTTVNNTTTWGSMVETWTFLAGNWSLLPLTFAPPNRAYASMAYDPSDGLVLLFGGSGFGGSSFFPPFLGDTWSYVGGNWTNLTGAVGAAPSPRQSAPMVWDTVDGYAVLFGGMGIFGNISGNLSETWTFSAGSWTHLVGGPGPQNQGAMAYDAVDGYVVYFGGAYAVGGTVSETWEFSAGAWTDLTTSVVNTPPSRANPAMSEDPNLPGVLLFGGIGQPSPPSWVYYNDTWGYANLTWTLLSNASGPSPREQSSMVFDAADNETVLFGGVNYSQGSYTDTWAFNYGGNASNSSGGGWTQAAPVLHLSLAVTDVGVPVTLSAVGVKDASSASIAYSGLPPGCSTANAVELTCVPTLAGNYTVVMTAVTASGTAAASTRLTVTDPPSIRSFQATRSVTEPGLPVTLTADAIDGAGTLTYAYAGLPTACPPADMPVLSCTPDATGFYPITVTVSDSLGVSTSQGLVLNVIALPQVGSLTVSPGEIDLGQTAHIAVSVVGGLAPASYDYTNLPPGCSASNSPTLSCAPSGIGVYSFGLVVTDALGGTATALGTLTTNALPAVTSFVSSSPNVTVGNTVTFTVAAAGGTGTLSIEYAGLPPGCVTVDAVELTCTPLSTGNFTIAITATDAVGVSASRTLPLEVDPSTPGPHGPGGPGSSPAASPDTTTPFLIGAGLGLLALGVVGVVLVRRARIAREGARLVRDLRAVGSGPIDPGAEGDSTVRDLPSATRPPGGGGR